MNHVYRLKRSGRTQQLQPVPETARAAGKGTRTGKTLAQAVTATLASVALGGIASLAYAQQAPPASAPTATQLPQGGVVTRGSANIVTHTGQAQLTVNQSSNRAVIDWTSFNVGSQAKVQFNQPSSSAVTLNNILGHNASQIYGQISANGQVFLSNPNGVYFSPTAQVNVGGLVATTGKANADDFMAGKVTFNRGGSTGSVVNQGQLTSAAGGYIALLAPEVRNQGVVIAQAGTVALASGEAITLNFNHTGTGLAGITTTPQAIAALVENRSAVVAEGGQIILSAHALASLQGSVVKNSGHLSATSLSTQGGKIVLMGDSIELTGTSQIEASGATGGGTVLVGGDWQGSGDMRQATQVTMAQGASIEANATGQGDGGKVVLWSDIYKAGGLTQVEGRIEAKGAGTGNGGQVETSGYSLQVGAQTQVNTGGGEWLLDPSDITISSGTTSGIALSSNIYTPTTAAASSVVNATTLVGNLATNNINITTTNTGTSGAGTGNITVAADLSWASNKVLTLTAAGGISGSGNISMTGAAGTGLVFKQEGNSTYAGSISGINATFTKQGAGNLTLTGTNTYAGLTKVSAGSMTAGVDNAFGTGAITLEGGSTLNLGDFSQTAGAVNINTSGGTITSTTGVLTGTSFGFSSISPVTTISANLGGPASPAPITHTGTGKLILTGNLTNIGNINVSNNLLQIGDGGSSKTFNVTGSITVSSAATLAFNRTVDTVLTNPVHVTANGTFANLAYGTVLDLSGTLIGSSSSNYLNSLSPSVNMATAIPTVASIRLRANPILTRITFNVLTTGFQSTFTPLPVITWTGANTGTPALKLNGDTVVSGAQVVGAMLTRNSGDLTIGPGALWSFTTAGSTRYITGTSDATDTTLSGTSSINVAPGVSATQSGAISDTVGAVVGLTVSGGGTLTLSGNNSNFSGGTTLSAGTLKAGSSTAFGTGAISVTSGAALDLNGQAITGAGNLTLNGTGVSNSGALMNSGGSATYPGLVLLGANSSIVAGSGSIALTNTGNTSGATYNLTLGGAAGGSFAGAIGTTTGSVTKEDGGAWVLSGSNTFSGGTFINGGTLQISSDANLGAVPGSAATNITINGGTLAVAGQVSPGFVIQGTRLFSIGNSGGTIANNGSHLLTLSGAISSSGPVTLTGGDLTFGSITVSNASPILVKTTGNLVQSASSTVSSQGGNITYWSDSDGSGDGKILLTNGASGSLTQINANGGNIVMGGGSGANAAAGMARGNYGVHVGNYASVQAGTGNVTIQGESNANIGGGILVGSNSTVSGANVTLTGAGFANTSGGSHGVQLSGNASASNLLAINGTGGGTASTSTSGGANYGVFVYGGVAEATGAGSVVINATGGGYLPGANNNGLFIQASTTDSSIRSVSGSVLVTATPGTSGSSGASVGVYVPLLLSGASANVRLGGSTQTGALTLRSDSWYFEPNAASNYAFVQGAGPLTLEPLTGSTSFASTGLNLSYVSLSTSITSLTLGKAGNTAPVYVGPNSNVNFPVGSYSVAGPISIFGDITLGTPLATTGTGANGLVTLTGNVSEVRNGKLTAPSLLLAGTGASNVNMSSGANALGTIAGSGLGSVNIETGGPAASGAMTVGTVGGTVGLTASGPVTLSTYSGNLTLANDIVTINTGTSAVTLNAGKVSIALGNNGVGNTTSGNVVLGGGTITTGTNGRVRVFTGSIADSTGLGTLVGAGSGRFRYGSTASTTNYTTALGNSGIYAIYRERPTVTWTSSSGQTVAYGVTPVSPAADAVAGLANGDTIDSTNALRLASNNSLASTNANGFYNAGSYFYSRTEGAKALGYLVTNPSLTINRATVTVTAVDVTKTYDGLAYSGGNGVTYSGFVSGDTAGNSFKGSLIYSGSSQSAVNANSYTIMPGGLALNSFAGLNYTIAYAPGTLTVAKAPLTVRINNDARFLTETDASTYKSASYSGFVGGQRETTPGVLGGTLVISRSSSGPDGNLLGANTLAGTYTGVLSGSGLSAANYIFNYVPGNYTIVPANQLLVQVANTSANYASDPVYTVTSAKYLRSGDNSVIDLTGRVQITGNAFTLNDGSGGNTAFNLGASVPSLSLGGQLNVGAYQLGASSIVTNANYSNTMTLTGALQVNPKAVTATVTSSLSKAYDGKLAMNGLTLSVSGAVSGDAVGASGVGAYDAKDVGTSLGYSVKNITLAGASARNYWLTDSVTSLASNTLTGNTGVITAVPLTVTANNDSKTFDNVGYSGGNGVTFSGFVNNETEVDLGGALLYGGTSQTATNAGTYTIIPSGYSSTNYTIGYGNGTLTINPVNVTAIVGALRGSVSKVYDGNNTATLSSANYSLTGWVGSDGATVTKTTGAYDTTTAGTNKTVTVSLTDSDYTLNSGTLLSNYNLPSSISGPVGVISAKQVTVTNTSRATTYDGVSTYGVLASGTAFTTSPLVGSDNVASVTQTPNGTGVTFSGIAQAGNFGVTASNAVLGVGNASNYDFSYANSSHIVDKANLALTAVASLTGNVYNGNTYTGTYTTNALGSDASGMSVTGVATGINAGTYRSSLAVTGAVLANYNTPVLSNADLVISAKPVTVTNLSRSTTYDGVSSYSTLANGTQFTSSALEGLDRVGSVTQTAAGVTASGVAQAGNFMVTPSLAVLSTGRAANYSFSYVDSTHTVDKANLALTATASLTGNVYRGSAYTGTYTTNALGSDASGMSVTGVATGTNAGTYRSSLAVTGAALSNYNAPVMSNADLVIAKAPLTATGNSLQLRYSGTTQSVSGYTVSGLQGSDNVSGLTGISASGASGMNVGSYANTMTVADQPNYTVTGVNGALHISAAPITLINGALQGVVSKTYDGTKVATLSASNYVLTGWLGGDLATVTKTTGTFDNANAGTNKTVTVDLSRGDYLASGSTDLMNYILPTKISGSVGQISKATVTPSILASNKVYDTTVTANGAVSLAGVFSVDAAAATAVAASYSFADANVGQGKTVTASGITLGSGLTSNYVLASTAATASANITPAPLTVTAINDAKFVTRNDVAGYAGFTVSGLLNGQSPADAGISAGVTVSRSNLGTETAGEYRSVLVPTGNATIGNYAVSYVPGNYTIVPARQLLVQANSSNTAYGTAGSPVLASVSYLDDSSNTITNLTLSGQAVVGGNTVYTYADGASGTVSFSAAPTGTSLSAGGFVNVGSYGLAAGNVSKTTNNLTSNTVTMTGNLTVQPLAVNVAATPGVTTYNSAAQTQATTSGLLSGDDVSIAGVVSQRNAGSYTSALSVLGSDATNYRVTFANSNYTINPAVLNATFAAANKVYDGNTTASLTSTDNRLGSDALTVSATGRFADKNVGAAKAVTVSAVALSGADASNYIINASGASPTASITRLAQVTWVGGTTGSWFNPENWAGGAVPDLANVANVTIPAGVTVSFDNSPVVPAQAGPVSIDSLGVAGSLSQSAGTLNVGPGGVTLNTLTQSGGELATTGALTLGSLSQTAGSLSASGLSTAVPYSHSGSGSLMVAGQVVLPSDPRASNLPVLPVVLTPDVLQGQGAYQVTVLKLPRDNEAGVVHIDLRDGMADIEMTLPAVLQKWLIAAGAALRLDGSQEGVELTENRSAIRLSDSANRRFPLQFDLLNGDERVSFLIVKRP